MKSALQPVSAAIVLMLLTACAAAQPAPTPTPTDLPLSPTPTVALEPTEAACPVTLPNGKSPPDRPASDGINHGNADGSLYTILRPEGILIFDGGQGYIRHDGAMSLKWPWFRGVPGRLTIRERRLDAPGITGSSDVPCCYSDLGFQPTGLILPSTGCWEITGSVGDSRLTFVMLVVQRK